MASRLGLPSVVAYARFGDVPDPSKTWPEALAATVGLRVARYRKERGLNQQQLSAELSAFGLDLKRTVINNLERGYRRTVSLAEVYVLAYVLGVPPLLLMTPLGAEPHFDVLPGTNADTWDAARWIAGEGPPPPGGPETTAQLWRSHADLLTLYREHTAKEAEWRENDRLMQDKKSLFEGSVTRRIEIETLLRIIRRAIRGRGDLPPALPPRLAYLDEEEAPPRPPVTEEAARQTIEDERRSDE